MSGGKQINTAYYMEDLSNRIIIHHGCRTLLS